METRKDRPIAITLVAVLSTPLPRACPKTYTMKRAAEE
jgi:hypothetical protein